MDGSDYAWCLEFSLLDCNDSSILIELTIWVWFGL